MMRLALALLAAPALAQPAGWTPIPPAAFLDETRDGTFSPAFPGQPAGLFVAFGQDAADILEVRQVFFPETGVERLAFCGIPLTVTDAGAICLGSRHGCWQPYRRLDGGLGLTATSPLVLELRPSPFALCLEGSS